MKQFFVYLALTIVLSINRFNDLMNFTEADSGFIALGHETILLVANVLLLLSMAYVCATTKKRKFAEAPSSGSFFYGGSVSIIPLLIVELGLTICALYCALYPFRLSLVLGLFAIVNVFAIALTLPIYMKNKVPKENLDGIFLLSVVCFGILSVVCIYLNNTVSIFVPQLYMSVLAGLALTVGALFEAKLRSKIITVSEFLSAYIPCAMMITVYELPTFLASFMGAGHYYTPTSSIDIAFAAFIPYMWFNIFIVTKNASTGIENDDMRAEVIK